METKCKRSCYACASHISKYDSFIFIVWIFLQIETVTFCALLIIRKYFSECLKIILEFLNENQQSRLFIIMKDSVPKLEDQNLLDLPDEVIEDNIMCYLSLKDLHNCSKCEMRD